MEGKTIAIEYRYPEGELDGLPGLANELVQLKVSIVVSSTPAVLAAGSDQEIPIVFHTIGDPVASGVVASLAGPGGNVTGLTMGGVNYTGSGWSF